MKNNRYRTHRLPWEAVKAVLKCPHLNSLRAFRNVDMTLDNIRTLASNRSSWTYIDLPLVNTVGYQALIPFAQNCPKLAWFGVTLGRDAELPSLETFETGSDSWFPLLTTLSVHESTVTYPIQVGKFLASICTNPLKILTNGKDVSSWEIVQEVVNSINSMDLDEYYKEVDLGDYDSEME